jgi:hypothetical protein
VLLGDPSAVRGYQSLPLPGSPARRLQEDARRLLGSGAVERCPHPDQPPFWYVAPGRLACVPCTCEYVREADERAGCDACGGTAVAVAAWVVGDVPCLASLCKECHRAGLVPLTPN